MKLGILAALTGIAVAVGLSQKKRADAAPVPAGKRSRAPAPRTTPVTGAPPLAEKTGAGARTAAP